MSRKNIRLVVSRSCYLLLCCTIAVSIIIVNIPRSQSQVLLPPGSNSEPLENLDIEDLESFSDIIERVEKNWERDYEGYFGRNFANRDRSATQIAQHLREIQQQAGIKPAVIWAVPKDDFLQLMLITPKRQFVIEQIRGGNKAALSQKIQELEIAISNKQSLAYLPPARLIYRWLLLPLEPYLEAEQIDTLLFCTGATLRSLPFAALHDGEQFVVEKYNIARIPAFNLTNTEYRVKSLRQVLAAGATEFTELPALPGIAVELNTIVPNIWQGSKLIDGDFTVDNLRQTHKSGNFDIVHIASHSEFNAGSPEESFIQFSDRKLSLAQITDLELDAPLVDLLVLSSCETALGNEDAEFGFAGLAMQAGVKSALASLWGVDDTGTTVLMSEFYQKLRSTPIKSLALRQAQIAMLDREVFVEDSQLRGSDVAIDLPAKVSLNESGDFQHPYYWAGFTIIGNPW